MSHYGGFFFFQNVNEFASHQFKPSSCSLRRAEQTLCCQGNQPSPGATPCDAARLTSVPNEQQRKRHVSSSHDAPLCAFLKVHMKHRKQQSDNYHWARAGRRPRGWGIPHGLTWDTEQMERTRWGQHAHTHTHTPRCLPVNVFPQTLSRVREQSAPFPRGHLEPKWQEVRGNTVFSAVRRASERLCMTPFLTVIHVNVTPSCFAWFCLNICFRSDGKQQTDYWSISGLEEGSGTATELT